MIDYIVYTDGAYSPKNNIGGIAFTIFNNKGQKVCVFSKPFSNTTNQRMEQMACILALHSIKVPSVVLIYTDSMYVVGTMMAGWKRKCNEDLWAELDSLVTKHKVVFKHVKGHDGNEKNDEVDRLAVEITKLHRKDC